VGDLVVANIGELITNHPARGDVLGTMTDVSVVMRDGLIAWIGADEDMPDEHRLIPAFDARGNAVIPGFVDAHTHAVFAGDRAHEHAMRLSGASYAEIQASGGGIYSTVRATRDASMRDLVLSAHPRLERMLASGTTTVEIKTGYGLDVESELKMLDVIDALASSLPIDIVKTFLGAHVVAPEFADDRQAYVELVSGSMLDAVRDRVSFVDVFCDEVAFSVAETERIASAAKDPGSVSVSMSTRRRTPGVPPSPPAWVPLPPTTWITPPTRISLRFLRPGRLRSSCHRSR
jgi:imidazolonepropionase